MMNPPIEFRFQRVGSMRRVEDRCRRHAEALLPRTGDIEGCKVTIRRGAPSGELLDGEFAPYEVRVEVRRQGGEVFVDRASAPAATRSLDREELVVRAVDEALHRVRRNLANAEFDLKQVREACFGLEAWSRHSAGSGEVWYG